MIVADTANAHVRLRLDAAVTASAPHLKPLLAAVRDAGCNFAQVPQHVGRFAFPEGRPLIALIGDDYDLSWGPQAFHRKSIRRLVGRCSAALIVAGAPDVTLYTAASGWAVLARQNVVVIETQPRWEADWANLVREARPGIAVLISTPKPAGGIH